MKYAIAFVFVLFAVILACSAGASKTIDVPGDSRTIRAAVEAAEPGDIITVAPGIYRENIEIEKELTLQGGGIDTTTLLGGIVINNADGVTIDGFTLDGQWRDDSHRGIWCSFSTLTVTNNAVIRYHHGITSESSKITIENNAVLENFNAGIEIKTAVTALIMGTTVVDNIDTGIVVALSGDNVLITDSVITGNRVGIDCVQCAPAIRRNVIERNKLGIKCNQDAEPDLGTDDDPGLNAIMGNECQIMNLERRRAVQAKNNYWGSRTGPDVSKFDGKIDFEPWLETDPLRNQSVKPRGKLAITWGRLKS